MKPQCIFLFENNTMEIPPVVGCQDSMLALTNGTPKAEAVETLSLSRRDGSSRNARCFREHFSHRFEGNLQFFCFDAPQILDNFWVWEFWRTFWEILDYKMMNRIDAFSERRGTGSKSVWIPWSPWWRTASSWERSPQKQMLSLTWILDVPKKNT